MPPAGLPRPDALTRWPAVGSPAGAPGPGRCGEQPLPLHEGLAEVLDERDRARRRSRAGLARHRRRRAVVVGVVVVRAPIPSSATSRAECDTTITWLCSAADRMSRARGGSKSGCSEVSGSLSTSSGGGRGEQGRDEQQVAQGAVGELGARERAQHAGLVECDVEAPPSAVTSRIAPSKASATARSSAGGRARGSSGALPRGRARRRRAPACACRRAPDGRAPRVGAEGVVEAPAADHPSHPDELGCPLGVGELGQHALPRPEGAGRSTQPRRAPPDGPAPSPPARSLAPPV